MPPTEGQTTPALLFRPVVDGATGHAVAALAPLVDAVANLPGIPIPPYGGFARARVLIPGIPIQPMGGLAPAQARMNHIYAHPASQPPTRLTPLTNEVRGND